MSIDPRINFYFIKLHGKKKRTSLNNEASFIACIVKFKKKRIIHKILPYFHHSPEKKNNNEIFPYRQFKNGRIDEKGG